MFVVTESMRGTINAIINIIITDIYLFEIFSLNNFKLISTLQNLTDNKHKFYRNFVLITKIIFAICN